MPSGFHIRKNTLSHNLRIVAHNLPQETAQALYDELHEVEEPEIIENTPIETGKLRGTIKTQQPEIHGAHIECRITAGGSEAPYAKYVHEDPEAHHPIGRWKFLEYVLLQARPFLKSRVAARMDLSKGLIK